MKYARLSATYMESTSLVLLLSLHGMYADDPQLARDRRVSRTESRVLEALQRRDRKTRRPRDWIDLKRDSPWLEVEVGTPHLKQLLHRMAMKGSLFAVGGGRYVVAAPGTFDPSQTIAFQAALDIALGNRPYYLAYAAAMADHGLIDESVDVVVAVKASAAAGSDTLRVQGRDVHLVRIASARKWFGQERVALEKRAGYWRSDLERTLLDIIDRPEMSAGLELVARAWERAVREQRVDHGRLVEYSLRLGGVAARRAVFFSRASGLADVANRIMTEVGRTRSSSPVDPTRSFGDGDWPRDRETGLVVNLPDGRLHGWMTYGK
jgi:predicted transcriptional regulator of viral defense system